MSELTLEQRRTTKLRQVLPLYEYIQLTVDSLDQTARCSVPLNEANSNHFGVMHAAVLFALAEITAGQAIAVHREFNKYLLIAKHVEVSYRRQAKSTIVAVATIGTEELERLRAVLRVDPKASWEVRVELFDDQGALVADSVCTFVFR